MDETQAPQDPTLRPYFLGEAECRTVTELAFAMANNPALAAKHIENGYVQKWLEEDLRNFDAKIALDALLKNQTIQKAIFDFALDNAPHWKPTIDGIPITGEGLTIYFKQLLKDEYVARTPQSTLLASLIYDWGLLTDPRITKGDTRLARIDDIWRSEVKNALSVRGRMLLYEALYAVPGDESETRLMADKTAELDFIRYAIKENAETEAAIDDAMRRVWIAAQSDILAQLLNAEDLAITPGIGFLTRYSVRNDVQFDDAIKRPWFADMLSDFPDQRSAGTEAALRDAMDIAAMQTRAIERGSAAIASLSKTEGSAERWLNGLLDKLGMVGTAGLFALPVLVLTLLYPSGVQPWHGLQFGRIDIATYVALGATIGLAPFRLLSFTGVDGGRLKTFKLPILAFLSLFIGILIAWPLHEDLFYNEWPEILGVTGLAALAGLIRKPSMALRQKQIDRMAQRRAGLGNRDSTKLLSFARVQANFFPETINNLPLLEHTAADHRIMAALRHGATAPAGLTRHVDSRSPAAPNNPDGVSIGIGGTNIAGDRATIELVDGVSMDTKGNFNTRLVDGLTVHSKGGYTVNAMKGVDIRSDGQISVEAKGARFSFGGKKEEKDEWDWGTGEKKAKGWFD